LKPGWGVGILVAVLVSIAFWLLNILSFTGMISLGLLLCGLWTVVAGLVIAQARDRMYYSAWGVVIAALSLFYFIPANYTIALVLLAIVALIIINVYLGRGPRMYEAAANPTPAQGGTPAAS